MVVAGGQMELVRESGERRRRRDAGEVRLTERDLWALRWIGEQYAVRMDQLSGLLGSQPGGETSVAGVLSERRTRRVVERWRQARLVETRKILYAEPGWVWLTRAGLRAVGLEVKYLAPRPMWLNHIYWCGQVRRMLRSRPVRSAVAVRAAAVRLRVGAGPASSPRRRDPRRRGHGGGRGGAHAQASEAARGHRRLALPRLRTDPLLRRPSRRGCAAASRSPSSPLQQQQERLAGRAAGRRHMRLLQRRHRDRICRSDSAGSRREEGISPPGCATVPSTTRPDDARPPRGGGRRDRVGEDRDPVAIGARRRRARLAGVVRRRQG